MRIIMTLGILMGLAGSVQAHEFWLEPLEYRVAPGGKISARALNGQEFVGKEYSYNARGYERSGIFAGSATGKIPGQTGQRPAVQVNAIGPGLNVIYHQSAASTVVYETMEKFESFLRGKRLEATLAEHKARGLPSENIVEGYFRFVKALVAVGDGAGADRAVGMPYELVALTNPYTGSGDMRLQLLYRGKPEANQPVYVFHRRAGKVKEVFLRTDGRGVVSVPRMAGEFQVNAVKIMPAGKALRQRFKAVWQTLWASSVYEIAG